MRFPPNESRRDRLAGVRERAARAGAWANERVPGVPAVVDALERERFAAAGLLAGGIAYRLFFWLVPLGLVLAALGSFWVEEDREGLEDAAGEIGLGGAASHAAADALEGGAHSRWYFLVVGSALLFYFSAGVVRSLYVAHAVAWRLRPEKPRRIFRAGFVFTGLTFAVLVVTSALAWLREQMEGPGLVATLLIFAVYAGVWLWVSTQLPHRGDWRALVPGATELRDEVEGGEDVQALNADADE